MAIRYPKCDKCEKKVTQVYDQIVKGKRVTLCSQCARNEGWMDGETVIQLKLPLTYGDDF